ncbi:hypothetical protein RN001_016339 [Aquatica leii]|uniref:Acyl-coenzyme A oxidase n=1 Tax=Aquatica leii TaxID=1421715 RepID=A0AAN7NUA8_9COLE|nr:hypothetical protein RN001_016339 [Aquatica leii]
MESNAKETVNSDLLKERQRCTFDTLELTHLLDGGPEKTAERREREIFFLDDPELKFKTPPEYLSHQDKYGEAIRLSCVLFRKIQELQKEGKAGIANYREILGGQIGSAIMKDGNPLTLHYVMFIPTVMGQGTYEQQAEWIQKAWNCDIVGTYAQTELGHGTFIRGLETTATYDPKTEEFVIHSPTLTSYKWWPGGLGHTANYAVVVAQLNTLGKCYGIHSFIVQLRDEETHKPLPGIKIGEIGCKLGMNTTNNGYLGFDNVRIPRKQMLMKNNKVLKDGTYVESPSSKLTYGTMMFVRVVIVQDAADYLKKAVIIAIRYSCVRRQSQPKPDEPEPQILDYITQQYKLFPLISTYYAFRYSATWLWDMYNNVSSELEAGMLDQLPELHALACCLKAISSTDAALGIEMCRLACGGHGYMMSSNLPTTYGLVTAMCTYEGENTVLLLQTARFLMKAWQIKVDGQKLTPTVEYLQSARDTVYQRNVHWIISTLQYVAARKIELAWQHMNERIQKGISSEDAWNQTSIELTAAAEAHGRAFIVSMYCTTMEDIKKTVSKPLRLVLIQLLDLYGITTAFKCLGDILRFTKATGADIEDLQLWLEELLTLLRPNAVGLVDSFDVRDEVLSSALGAYDGNVYERLFEEASKSPLNSEPVHKSFDRYLKPFLKSQL